MAQTKQQPMDIEDTDPGAPSRLLAAVLALAVNDLTDAPTEADRVSAVEFFWGHNSGVSDSYLMLLGYDPQRFKNALKAKLEAEAKTAFAV